MREEAVVMSAANLDILEENMTALANNIGQLSTNMTNVNTKVNGVTETVKTLEEDIRSFMHEIRESVLVSNAKESLLIAQNELEKKYGHYDEVRRNLIGILEGTDLNTIRRTTLASLTEQTLINTPGYWLSPALVALSAWFIDNEPLARKALNEALKRDDEKTSLLFSLIHARAGRSSTAYLWLNRYLQKQDYLNIENKFIIVLDAVSNSAFSVDSKNLIVKTLNSWVTNTLTNKEIFNNEVNRWTKKLESLTTNNEELFFPYMEKYTDNASSIKENFNKSTSRKNIYDYLIDSTNSNTITSPIDKIINLLIYNYETEEYDLKKEVLKNQRIIDGTSKSNEESDLIYQEKTNILTLLSNIILNDQIEVTSETKKLALSLIKDIILEAFNKITTESKKELNIINIKINNWTGTTTTGENEKELKEDLASMINKENVKNINKEKIIDYKVMVATILGILLIFLAKPKMLFIILIIILVMGFDMFLMYNSYKKRNSKIDVVKKDIKTKTEILENVICEIVDANYLKKSEEEQNSNIRAFLNNLNYTNYISSSNEREIIVGDING